MTVIIYLVAVIVLTVTSIIIGNILIHANSFDRKYVALSFGEMQGEPRTFNILINVFYPNIFVLLVYRTLLEILPAFSGQHIWIIVPAYYCMRYFLVFLQERTKLLDYKQEAYMTVVGVGISVFLYWCFYTKKINIFFDFSDMVNGIWLIVLVFFYDLIKAALDSSTERDREEIIKAYIDEKYEEFEKRYGEIIHQVLKSDYELIAAFVYAIMIYENYNRTRVHRLLERGIRYFRSLQNKPTSMGIMQVYSFNNITNEESVRLGTEYILNKWKEIQTDSSLDVWEYRYTLIESYNLSNDYYLEVNAIYELLIEANEDFKSLEPLVDDDDDISSDYNDAEIDAAVELVDYLKNDIEKKQLLAIISFLYLGDQYNLIKNEERYSLLQNENTFEIVVVFWAEKGWSTSPEYKSIENRVCSFSKRFILIQEEGEKPEDYLPNTLVLTFPLLGHRILENYIDLPKKIRNLVPLSATWHVTYQ